MYCQLNDLDIKLGKPDHTVLKSELKVNAVLMHLPFS